MLIIAPTPLPFASARELGLALLDLLEVDRHARARRARAAPSPSRSSAGRPGPRTSRRRASSPPSRPGRSARPRRPPAARRTCARPRPSRGTTRRARRLAAGSGSAPRRGGRVAGVVTIGAPRGASASCSAAQTAWIPAPPPSPMPFVPSGVNGDGDSIAAGLQRRHVERVRHVVVVEVGRQQVPVLVVGERLVRRGAEACAVAPITWPSTICGWIRVPQSSTAA